MSLVETTDGGMGKWAKIVQREEGGIITISVVIDKKALVQETLPAILAKMGEPEPKKAPKKRRKLPKAGAPIPDDPNQKPLPFAEPKPMPAPGVTSGGTSFHFGDNVGPDGKPLVKEVHPAGTATGQAAEKKPLVVVTNPGESLAEAKKRAKREQAAAEPAVTA